MKSAAQLKQKINCTRPVLGVISTFHFWPGLVELVMKAGIDYLIIDLEHLTHNAEMVAEACAMGRMLNFPILIRPSSAEFTVVRLAMDLGPCGLLVPYVQGPDTMNEIRDAVYLKPRGRRRPGGMGNAWVSDYNYATWKSEFEDDLIILPQIESKIGLGNVDAIARDPLTTAIAIGPYDLSADLGVCWQPESPELVNAVARVRRAGQDAGKNMWMIGDGPALAKQGFNFICLAEPIMLLASTLSQSAALVRNEGVSSAVADKPLP
jgi:2-keto-3-deoxy-L-rhamnonate aldolase RhmA